MYDEDRAASMNKPQPRCSSCHHDGFKYVPDVRIRSDLVFSLHHLSLLQYQFAWLLVHASDEERPNCRGSFEEFAGMSESATLVVGEERANDSGGNMEQRYNVAWQSLKSHEAAGQFMNGDHKALTSRANPAMPRRNVDCLLIE